MRLDAFNKKRRVIIQPSMELRALLTNSQLEALKAYGEDYQKDNLEEGFIKKTFFKKRKWWSFRKKAKLR